MPDHCFQQIVFYSSLDIAACIACAAVRFGILTDYDDPTADLPTFEMRDDYISLCDLTFTSDQLMADLSAVRVSSSDLTYSPFDSRPFMICEPTSLCNSSVAFTLWYFLPLE